MKTLVMAGLLLIGITVFGFVFDSWLDHRSFHVVNSILSDP